MTISAEDADLALAKVRQGLWVLEQQFQQLQAQLNAPSVHTLSPAPQMNFQGNGQQAFILASDAQKNLIMKLCSQLDCQLPDLDQMGKSEASEWIERHLELRKELLGR